MANDWKRRLASVALCGGLAAAAAPAAAVDPFDGNWHLSVTPYLWFPSIQGSSEVDLGGLQGPNGASLGTLSLSTRLDPDDYLQDLQFAIMLTGEARRGDWSVFTDLIYLDLGNKKSKVRSLSGPDGHLYTSIGRKLDTSIESTVWTLAGSYTFAKSPSSHFDVLAGFRYVDLSMDIDWAIQGSRDILSAAGSASADQSVWDGIVGVKGQVQLGDGHWYVPLYADIGAGDNNWTWQALVGVGYAFGWGNVSLSLRTLQYDFDKNDADLNLTGPALGVSFRW